MAESSYTSDISSSTTANPAERPRSEVLNEKFGAFVKFTSKSFTRARQVSGQLGDIIRPHPLCLFSSIQ